MALDGQENPKIEAGTAVFTVLAGDIMVAPVVTVAETMTLREAAELLCSQGISGAPVADSDGFIVGVVSEKDLLTQAQSYVTLPRLAAGTGSLLYSGDFSDIPGDVLQGAYAAGLSAIVRDVMSYPVIWAEQEDTAVHLADLMLAHRLNRVPILNRDGKAIGIVTRDDVLRAIILMSSPLRKRIVPAATNQGV